MYFVNFRIMFLLLLRFFFLSREGYANWRWYSLRIGPTPPPFRWAFPVATIYLYAVSIGVYIASDGYVNISLSGLSPCRRRVPTFAPCASVILDPCIHMNSACACSGYSGSISPVMLSWYQHALRFIVVSSGPGISGSVRSFATRASFRVSLFPGCVVVCKGPMFDFYVFRYSGAVLVLWPLAFCDLSIIIANVIRKLLILRSLWHWVKHGLLMEAMSG